jgi:histidinol-phosphate aminotransferase
MDGLRKVALPFGVSDVAQAAGVASLRAEAELQERVDTLIAERARVTEALQAAGWPVTVSQANFVWLQLNDDTDSVQARLEARGVITRPFSGAGIRITIADREAHDALLTELGVR